MQTSFLKQYIELNKKLIKTMTIKSEISADLVNSLIKLKYGIDTVDEFNPNTWKYYLNIAGQYHFSDTEMRVISLDTLDEIVFSKENLLNHVATADAYQYGTRYYYSLIEKYPDQEQLILGILYPADIDRAVSSKDGTILAYPKKLVEFQERTLIADLETFIHNYMVRWDVRAYSLTDDLYAPAQLAILYLNLVPALINLRARRCKTDEAHSFHIREYLASHYGLDDYLNNLTLKQAMFLYRNIRYIERNSGKIEQFKYLTQRLLTDRRIPITEYSVRQSKEFDSKYYPEIIVRKKGINLQYNKVEKDYVEIDRVYDKQRYFRSGNDIYLQENDSDITRCFKNSSSNAVQTKIVESDMVDYSESVPDTLENILMREWISHIDQGFFNVIVNFKDPKTFDVRNLYAKDALIYFQYIAISALGNIVYTIPDHLFFKARKKILPIMDECLSIVDKKYHRVAKPIIRRILDGQPVLESCYSVSTFNDKAKTIYDEALYHWYLVSNIHDLELRAHISNVIESLYYAKNTTFASGSMQAWLNMQNLPSYDYSYEEAMKLLQDIFVASTGFIIDKDNSLASIQKAMISIMEKLSSYTVQFISNINEDKIIPLNWAAIRMAPKEIKLTTDEFCRSHISVIESSTSGSDFKSVETDLSEKEEYFLTVNLREELNIETGVVATSVTVNTDVFDVVSRGYSFSVDYPEYDENISKNAKFIGEEFLVALPESSKKQIRSIY